MKRLAIMMICLFPAISFAAQTNRIDVIQEQCAKEKDPVKRQNSCDFLDKYSKLPLENSLPEFHKEVITA